ncbi:MAG TPA: hypothetical protein VMX35_05395 [Acidobacteriota bacterium]|nr:hypothetical protein [Acidobacteriota bacterium]
MNLFQRAVLIAYLVLITYASLWVPWRLIYAVGDQQAQLCVYGFLWSSNLGWQWATPDQNVPQVTWDDDAGRAAAVPTHPRLFRSASPDYARILLRYVAITAACGAIFLVGGFTRKPIIRG